MLSPLFLSSGDLTADRRYGFAQDLIARGDLAAAADLLTQALELAPGFASGWFALGDLREKLGDEGGAIEAFRQALANDAQDRHGATLRLKRLGVNSPGEQTAYLRTLFDQYADKFDNALVEGLSYRGPVLLRDAIAAAHAASKQPVQFNSALDLGCGTGLMGAALRPHVQQLTGVDLSPGMVAQAQRKGLYDRLAVADMESFLVEATARSEIFDLIVAADVFVYVEDLAPVIALAARVLDVGGVLAFTVETHDGAGTILSDTLRYAHCSETARAAVARAGLRLVMLEGVSTRTEKGAPVPGLLIVATQDRIR